MNDILNFSPEPCREWSDRQIHEALTIAPLEYLTYIRKSLNDIAIGAVAHETPPKQIITDDNGDFRSMPSVIFRNSTFSKIVKIVGTNNKQIDVLGRITVGKAFNLHPIENYITDIFDANILSSARTGAIAAIAAELLTSRKQDTMIIGCGNVGYYCAFYSAILGGTRTINFLDKNQEKANKFAKFFSNLFPNIRCISAGHMPSLVICATNSKTPVIVPHMVDTASTIISVGADTVDQRELAPSWFKHANIYVDSYDALRYGDCNAWHLNEKDVTLLAALFDPNIKMQQPHKQNIFITTGNALFDNLTIEYLLNGPFKSTVN